MQLKKHTTLVFKITVYCVSLIFAMISLTMMLMCKSHSAFLSSSFFKIAISFLSFADTKYLSGTTSRSSKYLDPVGENLRWHPFWAKNLHSKNDNSIGNLISPLPLFSPPKCLKLNKPPGG